MTDFEALSRAACEKPVERLPLQVLHDYLQDTTGRVKPTRAEVHAFTARVGAKIGEKKMTVEFGRRYARVFRMADNIYCFVDLTNGDVLMAASLTKPAKHPRGNIRDAFGGLLWADRYGIKYLR